MFQVMNTAPSTEGEMMDPNPLSSAALRLECPVQRIWLDSPDSDIYWTLTERATEANQ
jgi:hypothetical protein